MSDGAEGLFARWVEHHVITGEAADPAALCVDQADLLPELEALIARYLDISGSLAGLRLRCRPARGHARGAAAAVRGVPDHRAPRCRRDGGGLQAPRLEARSSRGREDHPVRPPADSRVGRIPRRSACDGPLPGPSHRADSRTARPGRPAGAHHGVRGGVRAGPPGTLARGQPARADHEGGVRGRAARARRSACSTAT